MHRTASGRRRKPKEPKAAVHDRTAQVLPYGANVVPVAVDDPYERGARIVVLTSLRDDPLGRLHARNQIDEAKYRAGREWQRLYELSEIGGIKAMDPTKVAVDGGQPPEMLTDRQLKAVRLLLHFDSALGKEGRSLVRDILGKRMFVEEAAIRRGLATTRGYLYIGRRFHECLETLAQEMGFA